MAESLNPEQIQDILERGSFDEFIGVVEDHQLECKRLSGNKTFIREGLRPLAG
jgi:hypothetical protein